MTASGGVPSINGEADLLQALREVFPSPFENVSPAFELIHDLPAEPITEVILGDSDNRLIVASVTGRVALMHTQLKASGLPVLTDLSNEKLLMLSVPPGTRPLSQFLNGVQHDPKTGGMLFFETGRVVRNIERRGLGFPRDSLLNQFGVVIDGEDPQGLKICLVPPYALDQEQNVEGFMDQCHVELDVSGVNSRVASILVDSLRKGFESDD